MKKETGIEIICSLMIILFVYAGLSKLLDYHVFKFQLGRSPYLAQFPGLIAWVIPAIELSTSILLLWRQTRIVGLYFSFFIMLLFTGYIYAMLHFSYFLPCSCGGILSMMSWRQHLFFNLFFTLVALSGILLWGKRNLE
jgi:hypothetical protein